MEEFVNLALGLSHGFAPDSTFDYNGATWTRSYVSRNSLRQVTSGEYKIIEQDPQDRGPYAALVSSDHAAHGECDGSKSHNILWVFGPGGLEAAIFDDQMIEQGKFDAK